MLDLPCIYARYLPGCAETFTNAPVALGSLGFTLQVWFPT